MNTLEVHQFPCLSDNYGYLVHDTDSGLTAAIDTPEVGPIREALDAKGWKLDFIFNTHHHDDHAGGNLQLKSQTGCQIIGPAADAKRIPGIDRTVAEGDTAISVLSAIPCLRSAAAGFSKAHHNRCGLRCRKSCPGRTRP